MLCNRQWQDTMPPTKKLSYSCINHIFCHETIEAFTKPLNLHDFNNYIYGHYPQMFLVSKDFAWHNLHGAFCKAERKKLLSYKLFIFTGLKHFPVLKYNLSENLKQLRHKHGWNQENVANRLDISVPTYSKIETGVTDINLSRLEQLAELFHLSIFELLTGDNATDPKEVERLKVLLINRDQEVIELQKEVILLYKKLKLQV